MTGQGGDGPAELTPEQREQVQAQAQVARRRGIAADLAKGLPKESALDLVRRRNDERRAERAAAAGRLDLGGAA